MQIRTKYANCSFFFPLPPNWMINNDLSWITMPLNPFDLLCRSWKYQILFTWVASSTRRNRRENFYTVFFLRGRRRYLTNISIMRFRRRFLMVWAQSVFLENMDATIMLISELLRHQILFQEHILFSTWEKSCPIEHAYVSWRLTWAARSVWKLETDTCADSSDWGLEPSALTDRASDFHEWRTTTTELLCGHRLECQRGISWQMGCEMLVDIDLSSPSSTLWWIPGTLVCLLQYKNHRPGCMKKN